MLICIRDSLSAKRRIVLPVRLDDAATRKAVKCFPRNSPQTPHPHVLFELPRLNDSLSHCCRTRNGMQSASTLSPNALLSTRLYAAPKSIRCRLCPRKGVCQNVSRSKFNARVVVSMAHTVFVYGTLLSEEIVQILLNRNPESHKGGASNLVDQQKGFLPD